MNHERTSNIELKVIERSTYEKINKMPAIGIDLGTSHCRIGVWQQERIKIIVDDQGNRQIPCFVAFTDTEHLIGKAAKNQVTKNTLNTIFDIKRFIGRELNDENILNAKKHWPFDLIDDAGKLNIQVEFRGEKKKFRPYEVISMILKKAKETAEAFLGEEVKDAVISVPACFSYSQRLQTKIAAKDAGLNVLRIINEPSAAALAYGLDKNFQRQKNVLIFDLGASKCDVSIISIYNSNNATFEVKSTAGNSQLGGDNFNSRLVEYFCEELREKYLEDIETDSNALNKLRIAAEQAKCTLSSSTQASIEINALCDGIDYYTKISRATFEDICADLFRSTLNYVQEALVNANFDKKSIHDIVLVGGSTHIPKIQSLLQNFFAVEKLNLSINSYEAVAYGAAVQAASLTGECNKSLVLQGVILKDIVTSSLGIETIGGVMTPIINRNECFPCKETRRFKTLFHNQLGLRIRILEGERSMAKDNNSIRLIVCKGLVPSLAPMIDVIFDLDVFGDLRVSWAYAQSDCNENIPTLENFYLCESIKVETEKDCFKVQK